MQHHILPIDRKTGRYIGAADLRFGDDAEVLAKVIGGPCPRCGAERTFVTPLYENTYWSAGDTPICRTLGCDDHLTLG